MRIAVCDNHVPFTRGGAERLRRSLVTALESAGHTVEEVLLPYRWYPAEQIAAHVAAWRLVDLGGTSTFDRVITLRFPAYVVEHSNKVAWLIAQHRTAYDLWESAFGDLRHMVHGEAARSMIHGVDGRALPKHRRLYAISDVVADRLYQFNGLASEVLYPPVGDASSFRSGTTGDYILYPSRMDSLKRHRLLVEAMARTDSSVRCILTGTGPEEAAIRRVTRDLGVDDRVEFTGHIPRHELIDLYADCLAVFNGPFDEDFGYATIEAMLSAKPVVTLHDSGGPLRWIRNGVNGWVTEPRPEAIAKVINEAAKDPESSSTMGKAGQKLIGDANLSWRAVVGRLTT